jgi:hypothetical protein
LEHHVEHRHHVDMVHGFGIGRGQRTAREGTRAAVCAEQENDLSIAADDDDALGRADRTLAHREVAMMGANGFSTAPCDHSKKRKTAELGLDDDELSVEEIDEGSSDSDTSDAQRIVKVAEMQAASKAKQAVRRGKRKQIRTNLSVWLAYGAGSAPNQSSCNSTAVTSCFVCGAQVTLNKSCSSSNLKLHYESKHNGLFMRVVAAAHSGASATTLKNMFVTANDKSATVKKSDIRSHMRGPVSDAPRDDVVKDVPATTLQRVSQVLYAAASETPFETLGSQLHQGYIASLGGNLISSSKSPLLDMLPKVYNVVNNLICSSSAVAKIGTVAVDGWSSAMGMPVTGMSLVFVDENWQLQSLPLGLINTEDMEKTSLNQAALMRSMIETNERVGADFVVHTASSDNEASIALAVDLFTNHTASVRCLVHTLSLVVSDVLYDGRDDVDAGYVVKLLQRVHKVATFVNQHPKVDAMLRQDQATVDMTSPDRIRVLKKEMPTRWYTKLMVLEAYFSLHDNLTRVFAKAGEPTPPLLNAKHLQIVAEVIIVLREVRRVGRALEAEKFVTASRAPRLLWELHQTLLHWSDVVLEPSQPRLSIAGDDAALLAARRTLFARPCVRAMAADIAKQLKLRLGALWTMADGAAGVEWDDVKDAERANFKVQRRALLFHMAAMFDVNECSLDWLDAPMRGDYFTKLYKAIALDKVEVDKATGAHVPYASDPALRRTVFEYNFQNTHQQMLQSLELNGRRAVDEALVWWRAIDTTRRDTDALPFVTVARAFLAMQASSASAERLFSDAGNVEGAKRHNQSTAVLEMNLVIRKWVLSELSATELDPGGVELSLLSNGAQHYQTLVRKVAILVHTNA